MPTIGPITKGMDPILQGYYHERKVLQRKVVGKKKWRMYLEQEISKITIEICL